VAQETSKIYHHGSIIPNLAQGVVANVPVLYVGWAPYSMYHISKRRLTKRIAILSNNFISCKHSLKTSYIHTYVTIYENDVSSRNEVHLPRPPLQNCMARDRTFLSWSSEPYGLVSMEQVRNNSMVKPALAHE
jgi:hypothetical protein